MMIESDVLHPYLNRIQISALIIGIITLLLSLFGAFSNTQQFYQSYLFSFLFWLGLSLGCLGWLGLHHLVGGGWGFAIQRLLEAGTRTLPLMALLFIPLYFGMHEIYVWSRPEIVANDAILLDKSIYLNIPFFWVRALVYFSTWFGFAFFLNKWSKMQDETGDVNLTRKMVRLCGPLLVFYVLTMTFASFDWGMSLEPHWFSTIYGFLFVVGQGLAAMAFMVIMAYTLSKREPLSRVFKPKHFHDYGNLMFAFILLWAYMSFSQFLIIWTGNLPEEIPWYLRRIKGGWEVLAVGLVLFHFIVPFFLLLMRFFKKRAELLFKIAIFMIFIRMVDLFWYIAPAFHPEKLTINWLDIILPVSMGGIWLAYYIQQLKKRSLIPLYDPRVKEALGYE
ncbi:MAG: hypothetical protein D6813_02950 [Calditrichaeota bacterium]|nr:MAG: hypothetical protein D6813_02950 [Calditrichota bacterium]